MIGEQQHGRSLFGPMYCRGSAQTTLAGASEPRNGPAMTSMPLLQQLLRARAKRKSVILLVLGGGSSSNSCEREQAVKALVSQLLLC